MAYIMISELALRGRSSPALTESLEAIRLEARDGSFWSVVHLSCINGGVPERNFFLIYLENQSLPQFSEELMHFQSSIQLDFNKPFLVWWLGAILFLFRLLLLLLQFILFIYMVLDSLMHLYKCLVYGILSE